MNTKIDFKPLIPLYLQNSKRHSIIITDFDEKYVYTNNAFLNRFGFITNDFIGKQFRIGIHADDHETCNETIQRLLENPDELYELKIRKPLQGEQFSTWTSWELSVLKENDKTLGILWIGIDVTPEERTRDELTNTNIKLQAILNSTTQSNVLISPDYKIMSFNHWANYVSELNLNKSLVINSSIWDYILDREAFYQNSQKAFKGETIRLEKLSKFPNKEVWLKTGYHPAYNQENEIIGVTFTTVDITKKKKSEALLLQHQLMLEALHNSTEEALTFLDCELKILFSNNFAKDVSLEISGKESKIGDCAIDYVVPELRREFSQHYQDVLSGKTIVVEKHLDKSWWRFSMFPVQDNDGKIIGLSDNIKNITKDKDYIDKIVEQNKLLNEIAWEQSHLVRKPLANILALVSLIKHTHTLDELADLNQMLEISATELDNVILQINTKSRKVK
ncbi:PAS domain-containing protein [Pedobacter arcticus]|uniref:PAS domain-containing protein n=1 Tax=Pedobacter arcticus TaxID=752140 RepID=UPI0002EBC5BA|nr:PAS domain-containing protein [Pedobacter arcticus]